MKEDKTTLQAMRPWVNDFLAVFTCELLVLTVGCRDGNPYMIDWER